MMILLSVFCIGCKKKIHCPEFPANLNYFPYYIGQELKFTNMQQNIRSFVITNKENSKAKVFNEDCPDCLCSPISSFKTNQNQDLLEIIYAYISISVLDEKIVPSAMMSFDFSFLMKNNVPFRDNLGVNLLSKLKKPILYSEIETYLPDTVLIEKENNIGVTKVVIVKGKGLVSYTTADGEEWKLVE